MKKILVVLFLLCSFFSFSARTYADQELFFDVSPDHTAFKAITALKNQGIIQGFSDNTFRPDQLVNRAEALKIILLSSNITPSIQEPTDLFPDVSAEEWFAAFVHEAKQRSIIQGNGAGLFLPDRSINQAEALKIVLLTNKIAAAGQSSFANIPADTWFSGLYAEAEKRQMLQSSEVNPSKELTRGEIAMLLYRFRSGSQSYSFPIGVMSYYGDGINGSGTASGEIFDNSLYTAAHRTLEFGTHLLVRSLTTGRAVVVSVNDRGPYVSFRNLDLSKAAFSVLANPSRGLTKAEIAPVSSDIPLGPVGELCPFPVERGFIETTAFSGITLERPLPTLFRQNEVFVLRGSAAAASEVTVFWEKDSKREIRTVSVQDETFEIPIPFLETGSFTFGMLTGRAGEAATFKIQVQNGPCLQGEGEAPTAITSFRSEIQAGNYTLIWKTDSEAYTEEIFRVLFTQGDQALEFFVNGTNQFQPPPEAFAAFQGGPAQVRIFRAKKSSASSLDITTPFSASAKMDMVLSRHHFWEIDPEKLSELSFASPFSLNVPVQISGSVQGEIREEAAIIQPDGMVKIVALTRNGDSFTLVFTPEQIGTYIVEINSAEGFAVLNAPVYPSKLAPLLPNYFDLNPQLHQPFLGDIELRRHQLEVLEDINRARGEVGLPKVRLEASLNELAQWRSEDMTERSYFSHTTPEQKTVNDALIDFGVNTLVHENIVKNVNLEVAHESLMRSAIHRQNILEPDWTRVGIGIEKGADGQLVMTQLFAPDQILPEREEEYRQQILDFLNGKRKNDLTIDLELTTIADTWAEKIGTEDAADETLRTEVIDLEEIPLTARQEKVEIPVYRYRDSLSGFLEFLEQAERTPLKEEYTTVGIGFFVNEVGIFYVVMVLAVL